MKYLMIFICIVLVFLSGCDKREAEKPILTVIYSSQPLYNVANHDTISIYCQMSGSDVSIANQKINVIYNDDMGLFVGSGASNYLITDEQGYASGFFKVEDNFYGDILIKFSPDHFPSQAKSIVLPAQDMPRIHTITASDTTLTSLNTTSDITVTITSHSDNIKDRWIHFYSSTGTTMENNSVKTDSLGVVHNVFHRNSFSGDALISSFLEIYPENIHYLTVHCQ
jgi:hypothetical protein